MAAFGDITGFGKLKLTVTAGASNGASALVNSRGCRIGSGMDDDMVLLAYDLFEGHVQLSGGALPFSKLRVAALGGSVRVGAQEIDPGQFVNVSLPARLEAGGCAFLIERPAFSPGKLRAVMAACIAAVIGIPAYGLLNTPRTTATDFRPVEIATPQPSAASDAALRAKLTELGLSTQISVKSNSDGSLTLSGQFTQRTADAWREFLQWYDGQPDMPQVLNAVTRADGNDDLPKIASVWAQDPPELIMEDGRVVRVGEQLDVNWKFDGLSEKGIQISRNGTKVVVEF